MNGRMLRSSRVRMVANGVCSTREARTEPPDERAALAQRLDQYRAIIAAAPEVALCWPGPVDEGYCLLVDGTAVADDTAETVTVTPTGAILHRLADASTDLPYCAPLDDPNAS